MEYVFTAPEAFGIDASPIQLAICRIFDGKPLGDLALDPDVIEMVGGPEALAEIIASTVPGAGPPKFLGPKEIYLISGIRAGKSLLIAARALSATQICDVSRLSAGDTPRFSVLSIAKDQAAAVYDHLVGNILAKPELRELLLADPTTESVMLRHPSGRAIEVKIVAGAKAGGSLIARWSAGVCFDEAPRMQGADDGVVNFDDGRDSILGRLLPGAQLAAVGSPWAPFGPVYKTVTERFGKPSKGLVVLRAGAHKMCPFNWPPEKVEEFRLLKPNLFRTEILGEFMNPEDSIFNPDAIELATRKAPLEIPPHISGSYTAAMDPGTRSNSWTFVIVETLPDDPEKPEEPPKLRVVLARQWTAVKGTPLDPEDILRQIATICASYGVFCCRTDQWGSDFIIAMARANGLALDQVSWTTVQRVAAYDGMATLVNQHRLELPPVAVVKQDLLSVVRRVTQKGLSIDLPHTGDGRHADYAPSLALAVEHAAKGGSGGAGAGDTLGVRSAWANHTSRERGGGGPAGGAAKVGALSDYAPEDEDEEFAVPLAG